MMKDLMSQPMISDLRVYEAANIHRDTGRKQLKKLEAQGIISPRRTPTGRKLLSIDDAERLANSF